jgi:chemotaxis signal transduction protein
LVRRESATSLGTRGVLAFPIGEILFGALVEEVIGLIEAEHVTPLPRQNGATAGVLAFRGSMIPAVDLSVFLDVSSVSQEGPRYGIVIARGAERFALLIPAMPRLIPGRELKEADLSIPESELGSLIGSVYLAGKEQVHCLRYWSIYDTVMPPTQPGRAASVAAR